MKTHTQPMLPEYYYHIFNRGINGEQLFKQERNYDYFLKKYAHFIEPIATTYAYVLMGNHFHFLVRLKTEAEIRQNVAPQSDKSIQHIISHQFARLFSSFAQAINKQEKRTGSLLEESFRRIPVGSEAYAAQMVYYIHFNPQKHKFTKDFRTYPYSSYHAFMQKGLTRIPREEVYGWFGSQKAFNAYHGITQDFDDKWLDDNWIDFDD